MDKQIIDGEQAEELFGRFTIFTDAPEMRWFKKAWKGFIKNGSASYTDEFEKQWVLARVITIGIMFNEFCEKAWEVGGDRDTLLSELFWQEKREFNLVILGNIVERDWFSDVAELTEQESFVEALEYLIYKSRIVVYDNLCKVFNNVSELFVSLWLCPDAKIKVGDYSEELLDSVLNDGGDNNKMAAFDYVMNGRMFASDA